MKCSEAATLPFVTPHSHTFIGAKFILIDYVKSIAKKEGLQFLFDPIARVC
ncbi:MAG: hypothetical protein FOGNACKC_02541 [Anaerolineae bacterium]|nr:hypothetical protein [Anaerolineae bacterium]